MDWTDTTLVSIDLDPAKIAKQLTDETGDEWTAEAVAKALDAYHGTVALEERAREGILDGLAESGPG